ncbi:MAG: ATP-binding protein [Lachnospiraceae bacterium]|nr:ATP-binding protein [Lachnospiraceae bacterium]
MSLKENQFHKILRGYDSTRSQNQYLLDQKLDEIYTKIPEYYELEQKLIQNSIHAAKMALAGTPEPKESVIQKNAQYSLQKKKLLVANGYPEDYLTPIYDCPDCKDTGYINGTTKCHCLKQSIINAFYQQSNLGSILESENFDYFNYDYYTNDIIDPITNLTAKQNIVKAVQTAKEFVTEFDHEFSNLFICGNTGVGKTFLTNCIAKELLDSAHTVIYQTAIQLFDLFSSYRFNHTPENGNAAALYEDILTCDLLIIDDLGIETINDFTQSQLYHCINSRLLGKRSVIISTNLSIQEVRALYSERIFSRITKDYQLIKIIGEDIRTQKAL